MFILISANGNNLLWKSGGMQLLRRVPDGDSDGILAKLLWVLGLCACEYKALRLSCLASDWCHLSLGYAWFDFNQLPL